MLNHMIKRKDLGRGSKVNSNIKRNKKFAGDKNKNVTENKTILKIKSILEKIHKNKVFEYTTITIILVSSLSIGVKTYEISPALDLLLKSLDQGITYYFLFEITIRIASEKRMINFFKSGWNIFDFIIVAVSIIPVNETDQVLLARLLRLFRVMRLIVVIPQLRFLITALMLSIPRVFYVTLMMFIIFYIYASLGSLLFSEINKDLWGNVGSSMLTLFGVATLEDWRDVMYETSEQYPLSWIFYISFIFLNTFIFLNMMIGVIINVMNSQTDSKDNDENKEVNEYWQGKDKREENINNFYDNYPTIGYNNDGIRIKVTYG